MFGKTSSRKNAFLARSADYFLQRWVETNWGPLALWVVIVGVQNGGDRCSHLEWCDWIYERRKFHPNFGWRDDGACQLGMWSICLTWPRLHSYSVCYPIDYLVMEHIQSKRDHIPGVTAIYFVEPTERNIGLILDVRISLAFIIHRILTRLSRLWEQRAVLTGMGFLCLMKLESSTAEWMTWVASLVCTIVSLSALKEVGSHCSAWVVDLRDDLAGRLRNNKVLDKRLVVCRVKPCDFYV